jgi:hypothetical protein
MPDPALGLSAADLARLDTWIVDIAEELRGPAQDAGNGDWRVGDGRALVIHRDGCWHDFSADKSAYGALSLLVHLHHGDGQAALKAAKAWLAGHSGDGRLSRADEDEDDAEAEAVDDAWRTAYVETLWQCAEAIDARPAQAYLKSRDLWPLPPGVDKSLRWTPGIRGDEGALVAAVTGGDGKVVAIQLTYITPAGEKSKTQPARRTLRGPHDWRSHGAFRIGAPGTPNLVLTEGVEDAIAALIAGAERAHACLGAAALGRAQLPITVERVIVARDDDPPGSPACVALGRGVARLLGQGRKVLVTPRAGRFATGAKDLLKCSFLMSHNARMAASITPSSLFRAVDAHKVSLFVDEADNVIKGLNPDLLAIMNAGADRMTAKVMRSEALANGQFDSREFNTFAPIALTSIHKLPDTLQDRTISLPLKRATKGERPERLTLRTRGPLIDIGRRLARWAADLKELPEPDLPTDLFNRVEDCWYNLFQIAKAAIGDWPERCRRAALADLARGEADDADGGRNADLLADVWEVFHQQRKVRLYTADLCAALNTMDESPWSAANHGKPVDGYYLRTNLAGFVPADAEKIAPRKWRGASGQARGYHEKHFEDAFERYLGRPLPSFIPKDGVGADPAQGRAANEQRHAAEEQRAAEEQKRRAETDAGTDGAAASDALKDQQHHTLKSKRDGWTDGTDTRDPSRARASSDPSEPQLVPDNQNEEPVVEFPRGASGRRRKQPKAEV